VEVVEGKWSEDEDGLEYVSLSLTDEEVGLGTVADLLGILVITP
jgi:hypothetical protein